MEGAEPPADDVSSGYLPAAPDGSGPAPDGAPFPLVGEGGMGRVVLAWDTALQRPVALKQLAAQGASGMDRRFLREARLAGRLDHPSIVPVHHLGTGDDGRPFYVMQHVRGRPMSEAFAGCGGLADRLALSDRFVALGQAVAFAHSRGVVHRDLKPDNVILGEYGETVLIDWGLAHGGEGAAVPANPPAEAPAADLTHAGALLGTPAYMSPEQARGETWGADPRADTWALEAILYEMLAGERLFPGTDSAVVLERVRTRQLPDLAVPGAPPELVAVVHRALAAHPSDRYAQAAELAADVQAWRTGALVGAYAYTPLDHLSRFARQHRTALAVAGFSLFLLVFLAGISVSRIVEERDRARTAELDAVASRDAATPHLAAAYVERARRAWDDGDRTVAWLFAAESLALREDPESRGIVGGAARMPSPLVLGGWDPGAPCRGPRTTVRHEPIWCRTDDAVLVWSPDGSERFPHDLGDVLMLALGPGGRWIATDGPAGAALHDLHGTDPPIVLRGLSPEERLSGVRFTPDGTRAIGVTGGTGLPGDAVVWALPSGDPLVRFPHVLNRGIALTPDARQVWLSTPDGLRQWDLSALTVTRTLDGAERWLPACSPDGAQLAWGTPDGLLCILRLADSTRRCRKFAPGIPRTAWSPDS
ncbi:MAG: hypothetical protein ACI9K2_004746, partial [Myxococcota bacterium]